MSKTVNALDELFSSVITLIPTWLSMLKSTRVLAAIGTGALIYVTWKYGGLTENQLLIVNGIEALTGISFMGFKTLRPSQTESSSPKADSAEAEQPAAAPVSSSAAAASFTGVYTPADLDAIIAEINASLKKDDLIINWQTITGQFIQKAAMYSLATVPPANRIEEARRWIDKAAELARSAFAEFVGLEAPQSLAEIGNYYDYLGRIRNRFTELYGCNKRPVDDKVRYQVRQLMEVYGKQEAINRLTPSSIDWSTIDKRYLTPWGITEQGI